MAPRKPFLSVNTQGCTPPHTHEREGGHSSSSSSSASQQSRMALRKHLIQNISSSSQQQDENTREDVDAADTDSRDELSSLLRSSSTREKRRRENHSKQKEMTEEEMMDLALRLSKQEASNTALRLQQENEDVMKAIQESMVKQTQPSHKSSSKSPPAGAPLRTESRRKLSYYNGEKLPEKVCSSEGEMSSEVVGSEDETLTRSKKRRRGTGSPLMKMQDVSQTQRVSSQSSPCSSESFSVHLDSPQSSDSTHIEDSQHEMSPVFPLTGCKAKVHINRLDGDLLETCKSSGFVLCSQDSLTLTQTSAQPRSPIFPQSDQIPCPKSPEFPGDEKRRRGQPERAADFVKNPLFDSTPVCATSPSASKHSDCENSEFCFSSQESLLPSMRSCSPQSPVFPKSPSGWSLSHKDSNRGQVERRDERSASPVFGLTGAQRTEQQESSAEVRGSGHGQSPPECRTGLKSDGCRTADCITRSSKSVSEKRNEKDEGWNSAETELTSDMTLVWSEQDEDDDDVTPVGSPSPVFPEEKPVAPSISQPGSSQNHLSAASQGPSGPDCSLKSQKCDSGGNKYASSGFFSSSAPASRQQLRTPSQELQPVSRQEGVCRKSPQPGQPSGSQTVHYYWGVPFCPRGLDPDTYTQVILAQMKVYEQSLKQAQRGLLRKAEWGEAIVPQPQDSLSPEAPADSPQPCVPRRRGLRLRGGKRSEAAGFLPDEEEERKDGEEEHQEKEKKKEGDEVQTDTDDCEVCPETQLSDDSAKDVRLEADAGLQPPHKSPEIEMILRDDSPTADEPQELEEQLKTPADSEMEEHVSGLQEDAGGQAAGQLENRKGPDVEEMDDRAAKRSESPELEAAVVPRSPETSVDCPICQGSFPASEIEMHAAYCDGEVAVVSQTRPQSQCFQDSLKPRRKRMRRAEAASEDTTHLSDVSRGQEKCFICQKSFPLRDYSRHTDLCLQRGTARRAARGDLLSALEQTERRDSGAGPSGSKPQPEAVIDLRDDDDDEEEDEEERVSAFRISNSPIRSFTPISEATGCLIDFRKQQRTKKPGPRRR